jgi:diguanylate cyclase (GGDEF)-like protein
MSGSLEESLEENRRAEVSLKEAKDDLEVRVVERTKELQDTNTKLLHEIAERKRVEAALAEAAQTDALTGLLNRRAIITGLQAEVSRYNRTQAPFSLLVCDIDHFKRVNDTYGHDVGDQVLKNVSDRLRTACRQHDLIARWGGEEFVVLLPETDLQGGMAAAEKLRESMTADVFPAGVQDLDLTLSIGVAAYEPGQTLDDCVKAADTAMYQAKSLGRNRVQAGTA